MSISRVSVFYIPKIDNFGIIGDSCIEKGEFMNVKKSLLLVMLFVLFLPLNASASQQSGQYYPPSHSDYFQKKFSWQLYSSRGIKEIRFTQFDKNGEEIEAINLEAKENGFNWIDFSCTGSVSIEFLDADGKVKDQLTRGVATKHLDGTACEYKTFVKTSNYDEKKNQYSDDTFGKKK